MPSFTRRSALALGAAVGVSSLAGCLRVFVDQPQTVTADVDSPVSVSAVWSQSRRDETNTAYEPDATAFDEPPGRGWTIELAAALETVDVMGEDGATIKTAPVARDETVFVTVETETGEDATLVTIDANEGEVIGETPLERAPSGQPIATETGVILPIENQLVEYDVERDERTRSVDAGSLVGPTTLVDGALYTGIHTGNGRLLSVDAETFEIGWERDTALHRGPPAVVDDVIVYGDRDGTVAAVTTEGDERWVETHDDYRVYSPVAVDDRAAYILLDHRHSNDQELTAFTHDGEETWRKPIDVPRDTSLAVAHGHVYAVSSDPRLHAFDAETGDEVWRVPGGNFSFVDPPSAEVSPVVAGNAILYVDHEERLRAVSSDGRSLWQTADVDPTVTWSPLVSPTAVVFGGPTTISMLTQS